MKKGVIFDLDGTLIHSLPDIAAAMNRSLSRFGLPVFEENAYKYKVGNGVLKLTERVVGDRKDLYDQVLNAYMEDVDRQAEAMFEKLVLDLAEKENVTEHLKATDQMEWVRRMNNIRSRAEEIVNAELFFV